MDIVHDGIELVCIIAAVLRTTLVGVRILSQIAHTVCFLLGFFLLPSAVNIVLNDVFQISNDRFAARGLGVVSRDDAGDLFKFFICILVVKKEFLCLAVDDDPPLASGGNNRKLAILQPAGNAIFLAELIDGLLLFPEPHAHGRAAVTHTITGRSGFLRGGELLLILFANATGDFAMGKVENFHIAFCAVEYHIGQLPSVYGSII